MTSYGEGTANHFFSGCLIGGFCLIGFGLGTVASERLDARDLMLERSLCVLDQGLAQSVLGGGTVTEARPDCEVRKVQSVTFCQTGQLLNDCPDVDAFACWGYTCRTDCTPVPGDQFGGTQETVGWLNGSQPCGATGGLSTYSLNKCKWFVNCYCSSTVITAGLWCPRTYNWWVLCAGP